MEQLTVLLGRYGYGLLFAVGFMEYAGAPIACIPVLLIAGALASMGGMPLAGVVLSVALGGLVADLAWYSIARWRGEGLVAGMCGLSSNPNACVIGVERRVSAVGPAFLLLAKFLPGAANLVAAASGYARVGLRSFVIFDAVGLLLWAAAYSLLGWLLAAQVEVAFEWASAFKFWVIAIAVGLIGGAAVWRVVKVRLHAPLHAAGAEGCS
jgi:membrane protein DedA with SNARE-associated domain